MLADERVALIFEIKKKRKKRKRLVDRKTQAKGAIENTLGRDASSRSCREDANSSLSASFFRERYLFKESPDFMTSHH